MLLAHTQHTHRRGAILLVVLTLLALFAVIGLSFVLFAESEAAAARIRRELRSQSDAPPSVRDAANNFLARFLYPVSYTSPDDLRSGIRGYDMATMVYGNNPLGGNTVPYNGIGTFSDTLTNLPTYLTGTPIPSLDRRNVVSYQLQIPRDINGNIITTSRHIVDPEHTGYRNELQIGTSPSATVPAQTYVGRNAPYTYPDRNNISVAMQDPASGQILVPSYHRPSLFGTLNSSNPRWRDNGDATGRYRILRPRPWDHRLPGETEAQSQFPFPPMNGDGSYTGDVQNIPNHTGQQRNDAVWVDPGLPVQQWRGRNILPLIAPTVLPLDGRVNVNTAGTRSSQGFGPWEVNLGRITADAATMVQNRQGGANTPSPRGTSLAQLPFARSNTQSYASVNWEAGPTTISMPLPTGNQSDPSFPLGSGFDSSAPGNTEANQHPGLFSPYQWNPFEAPVRLFPFGDLRRSATKYSGRPTEYYDPFYSTGMPPLVQSLKNTNNYSTDVNAQRSRALLTTVSNSLARPGMMPNFGIYDSAGPVPASLQLNPATGDLVSALRILSAATTNAVDPSLSNEFSSLTSLRSALSVLGAVDVNRPISDYRAAINPIGAITSTNHTNAVAAAQDRQTLARDIFVRLVIATGAKAIVTATTVQLPQPATPTTYTLLTAGDTSLEQYNAVRSLAQLAANLVDYIDNDDINTTFVWNPSVSNSTTGADTGLGDMTSQFSLMTATQATRTSYLNDRVVFGVEKPRVVLNEVYSEIANAPSDSTNPDASNDFHVRFWVELLNPGSTGTDATAPLSDNSVQLSDATSSPYKIQVFKNAAEVRAALYDLMNPATYSNVTGRVDGLPSQRVDARLVTAPPGAVTLEPNNGVSAGMGPAIGFRIVGPDLTGTTGTSANEFLPSTAATSYGTGLIALPNGAAPPPVGGMTPSATLAYQEPKQNPGNIVNTINGLVDQAVVLRRLANPHLPPNDPHEMGFNSLLPVNPYLTVDVFSDVSSRDAIRVGDRIAGPGSGARPMNEPPVANTRSSKGRTSPYTAFRAPLTAVADTAGFVAPQSAANYVAAAPAGQLLTFFDHNSQRRLPAATPIEWLVHLDRPLVNMMEALHVSGHKPHELSFRFARGTAAAPSYHNHVAVNPLNRPLLARAFELLSVKPWGYGIPNGGRVPGKININMIWDQATLDALLDQNVSNSFTAADVSSIYSNLLFSTASHARSKSLTPGTTVDEDFPPAMGPDLRDRPIKPLGVANFTAGGLLPNGTGFEDTLFRTDTTRVPPEPAVFRANPTMPPATLHPYQKAEMLRKMYNNITTTTDTYLVVMTVGFFEVRNPGPYTVTNPPVLGKEVFDETPGDLRGKFVSVVDRSMIALGLDTAGTVVPTQADRLFYTDIADSGTPQFLPANTTTASAPLSVALTVHCQFDEQLMPVIFYEGRKFILGATVPVTDRYAIAVPHVILGTGPDAVVIRNVAVTASSQTTGTMTFTGTVTVPANTPQRPVIVGTAVVSGLAGNPGTAQNFDVNLRQYQGVVPYFEQIPIEK